MITVHLLIIAGLLMWIHFLWSRRHFYKMMLRIPGPIGLPLVGIVPQYAFNKFKISQRAKLMDNYGSTIQFWMGITPGILTRDPNIAADVLSSPKCLNRSLQVTESITKLAGNGLLTLQEPAWNERRRDMNIIFKTNALLSFFPIFNAESRSLVNQLETLVGQGQQDVMPHLFSWSFKTSQRKYINMYIVSSNFKDHYGLFVESTLGNDGIMEDDIYNQALVDSWQFLLSLNTLLIVMPLLRSTFIYKLCGIEWIKNKYFLETSRMVDTRIRTKLNSKAENKSATTENSVINRLVELSRKGKMGLEDLKGECCNMTIAAFETTALTLFNVLILLAMFPEHQDRVFEELKQVYPTDEDFEVTYEDFQKMENLDRVINETLRLIPSVPVTLRDTKEEFVLSNGFQVPKGVQIFVDIYSIHRNKDHWGPEADSFNPDNFLPEKVQERHPFAFLPFSKGRRNCIGWKYAQLALKVALAMILRKYRLVTSFRYEDLSFTDNVSIKLEKLPRVELHQRPKVSQNT
ncbi:hypothetical protein KR018_002535 [Drosophila ironensis]|nr:hypothetical protein KR018_002535 [Drosophila ironensis]